MNKLVPVILLIVMLTSGCDLAGINLTPTTQSAAINSFGSSPPTIASGESSTLSWSVTGATTVSIDQGIGNVALAGSRLVMPTVTTVYTLTAINAAGLSVTATAQVIVSGGTTPTPTPSPTPSPSSFPIIYYFTASPSNISAGGSSTLSWSVSNATYVSINHGVGNVGSSGSTLVWPSATTNFTLTATNTAGSSYESTTVLISAYQPSFSVIVVTASVNPPSYSGDCPLNIYSEAAITVNGPGTVSYRWEDSEGGIKPTENVYFSSAGSQSVGTWWPVGKSATLWVRLHVLSPNDTSSNQASFKVNCGSPQTGGWAGTWSTTYGTMVLSQSGGLVSGTYTHDNGNIVGTVSSNILTGTWSEAPTYSAANNDAGDVELTMSPDGNSFTGYWRHGSSGGWAGSWSGTRISY
jgi:hypothetical protein